MVRDIYVLGVFFLSIYPKKVHLLNRLKIELIKIEIIMWLGFVLSLLLVFSSSGRFSVQPNFEIGIRISPSIAARTPSHELRKPDPKKWSWPAAPPPSAAPADLLPTPDGALESRAEARLRASPASPWSAKRPRSNWTAPPPRRRGPLGGGAAEAAAAAAAPLCSSPSPAPRWSSWTSSAAFACPSASTLPRWYYSFVFALCLILLSRLRRIVGVADVVAVGDVHSNLLCFLWYGNSVSSLCEVEAYVRCSVQLGEEQGLGIQGGYPVAPHEGSRNRVELGLLLVHPHVRLFCRTRRGGCSVSRHAASESLVRPGAFLYQSWSGSSYCGCNIFSWWCISVWWSNPLFPEFLFLFFYRFLQTDQILLEKTTWTNSAFYKTMSLPSRIRWMAWFNRERGKLI